MYEVQGRCTLYMRFEVVHMRFEAHGARDF